MDELFEDAPMMLLSPDHPYVKGFFPWIVKCFWGKKRTYEVRYRDFDTVRQDIGFETLEEAIECVAKLKNDARKVYVWPSDYEELSRSWGSTETPKKAQGMQQ